MRRAAAICLRHLAFTLAAVGWTTAASRGAELAPLTPIAVLAVSKPGQLAVSPEGDRVAICDRYSNRVVVFDSNGKVLWSVGLGVELDQPAAVLWLNNKELVFSQWDSPMLLHVAEDQPLLLDTVVDLSAEIGEKGRVTRLYLRRDLTYLALTENPDRLWHFDSQWKSPAVLIRGGSGRGQIGRSSVVTFLASGRLAVAGTSSQPLQIFDAEGNLVMVADWNSPTVQRLWAATAAAVDHRERIWVADVTGAQFRLYEPGGTLLATRAFAVRTARPADMVVTSDNHLIVVDASGGVDLYDLGGEP